MGTLEEEIVKEFPEFSIKNLETLISPGQKTYGDRMYRGIIDGIYYVYIPMKSFHTLEMFPGAREAPEDIRPIFIRYAEKQGDT